MDMVTHALSGAAIGAACAPSPREQLPLMLVGAAAALIPDLDALAGLRSRISAWRHHRVLLHGVATVPLQAVAAYAIAASLATAAVPAGAMVLTVTGSLLAHLLLDAVTSFGTALAYPFSRCYFSTRSHFIVDPVILAILTLAIVFDVPIPGLVACATWLAIGVTIRHRLGKIVSRIEPGALLIEPGPLAPFRWAIAVRRTSQRYSLATISWRGQTLTPWRNVESCCPPHLQERAQAIALVQAFLKTASCPIWEVVHQGPESKALLLEDLKWRVAPPFRPLAFVIHLGAEPAMDRAEQMPLWWTGPRPPLDRAGDFNLPACAPKRITRKSRPGPLDAS